MSGEQLERRYRGLLRVLPKSYRDAREEELLSVLMDGAAEGRRWPELREMFSMARLGLRVRVRGTGDGAVSGLLERTRLGEMARLVSIVGALFLAYVATSQLTLLVREIHEGMLDNVSWRVLNPFASSVAHPLSSPQYQVARLELPVCWLIVLALLAAGWWRAARVLAVVMFLLNIALTSDLHRALYGEAVLAAVTTVALFAARGRQARPVRGPGLVAVVAVVGADAYEYLVKGQSSMAGMALLQGWGLAVSKTAVAAAAVLVVIAGVVAYRSVAGAVALAVVAVAGLGPVAALQLNEGLEGREVDLLVVLTCALVLLAALAVLKERLAQRSAARRDRLPVS
jgi:hypothetical protein